jgi:hypothetical protein
VRLWRLYAHIFDVGIVQWAWINIKKNLYFAKFMDIGQTVGIGYTVKSELSALKSYLICNYRLLRDFSSCLGSLS